VKGRKFLIKIKKKIEVLKIMKLMKQYFVKSDFLLKFNFYLKLSYKDLFIKLKDIFYFLKVNILF
jgi:hypothetical protein